MRISDWSSDVCSSDLSVAIMAMVVCIQSSANHPSNGLPSAMRRDSGCTQGLLTSLSSTKTNFTTTQVSQIGSRVDRKSVVEGKSVSVRGDLGGTRIIKKKKQAQQISRHSQHNNVCN